MKPRKIVLLSCIGILLAACIVQLAMAARNPVKTFRLDEGFDSITIEKSGETVSFSLDGSDWYVGRGEYRANQSDMNSITNSIKEVKVLDTVGRLSSDDANGRWDLDDEKAIIVNAMKDGKTVRKMRVGKASSTGSQTYMSLDSSKDVRLVSGNLSSIFNKSEDAYRSRSIFTVTGSSVNSVEVNTAGKNWKVSKSSSDEGDLVWTASGSAAGKEAEASKVNSWINQISGCTASAWTDDRKVLPAKKEASVEIQSSEGVFTLDVYMEYEGEKAKYFGTSNRTPHKFELSESTAKRYIKTFDDLKK